MLNPNIYRRAAERLMRPEQRDFDKGCCWAIHMAEGFKRWDCLYDNTDHQEEFRSYFCPDECYEAYWWDYKDDEPRLLALLFMAEIAKDI